MRNILGRLSWTTLALFLILAAVFWSSVLYPMPGSGPKAVKGVLDLRGSGAFDNIVRLDGEWEYYPDQLLTPQDFHSVSPPDQAGLIEVPHKWTRHEGSGKPNSPTGFATLRLRIMLDASERDASNVYGIKVNNIKTAHTLFVNGKKIGGGGQPGTTRQDTIPFNSPYVGYFAGEGDSVEIVIQVSNYQYYIGGVTHPLFMGTQEQIQTLREHTLIRDAIMSSGLLLLGTYFLALFRMRRTDRSWLYLGLFGLTCFVFSLTQGEKLLLLLLPSMPYILFAKIQFGFGIIAEGMLLLYTRSALPELAKNGIVRVLSVGIILRLLLVLLTPLIIFSAMEQVSYLLTFITVLYIMLVMLTGAIRRMEGAVYMMIGALSILALAVLYRLQVVNVANVAFLLPIPVAAFVFSQVLLLSRRFTDAFASVELLSGQLLAADRQKDEFLANTSHEMNTPLHGIINLSQSLLDGATGPLNPEQRESASLIVSTGRRLSRLLHDILDMSRIRNGELLLLRRPVALRPAVRFAFDIHRSLAAGKPLRFIDRLPDKLPYVDVDEDRLVQILTNLIGNAVKFTTAGEIEVSAEERDGWVAVSVRDTGIGIPADKLESIFDSYEQAGRAEHGGIGLGLSITRRLLELHGGRIGVKSEPGVGSTFTFTLPVSGKQPEQPESYGERDEPEPIGDMAKPPGATSASERFAALAASLSRDRPSYGDSSSPSILIVDDDPTNRQVLRNLLAVDQMSVTVVENGEAALRELERPDRRFDLVILDWMMPGLSGGDVCRRIRARWSLSELPVLLLTARNRHEDMLAGFEAGANDFLGKPVEASELRARIGTLLAMKQSASDLVASELALLQAQIKPHFLFNTLNTIMAVSDTDLQKSQSLLARLSYYLRSSFDFQNRESTVTLDQEMELVKAYLFIEQARFGDRLQTRIEVDGSALKRQIPTMTIQPIVENAVRHGIMKLEEGGIVRIAITADPESIRVTVEDNGVGMPPSWNGWQEGSARAVPTSGRRTGIGLSNIHRRLLHRYGEGLHIDSKPGEGTRVSFRIPMTADDGR